MKSGKGGFVVTEESVCHRSITAIQNRAFGLDVRREVFLWADEEDLILIKYYPKEGGKVCKRFKDKTAAQCSARANKLKLKSPSTVFSEEDDSVFLKYYSTEGGEIYKRFNARFTKHQCMAHASVLGLRATTNSADRWTEEDNLIIQQYYPSEGAQCYLRISGSTPQTVACQAHKLGVKYLSAKNISKKVYCIETNETFDSKREAELKYHISHINEAISGKREYAGRLPDGTRLHWKYIEE